MKKIALAMLSLLLPAVASAAPVHSGMDIAAVVGGEAITSYDVNSRIRFVIATTNLPDTPDALAHIRPQVIRSLIDERLELREAEKNDVKVADADVKQAIAGIEAERHMPPGTIDRIMAAHHVPPSTFTNQIHAQLAWNRLIIKKIRPQLHVSDEELDLAAKRPLPVMPGKPQELRIAVLSLPVDKPVHDAEMRKLAGRFSQEIRQGASFEEVSRQFSSRAASAGGKVESFWVKPEQLDPSVAHALMNARVGEITNPVRTEEGYLIVKVYDVRSAPEEKKDMDVNLKEIVLKLKPDASGKDADLLLQIAREVAKHPGSCADKTISGIEDLKNVDIAVSFRQSVLSALPSGVKTVVEDLKVGDISTPFASDDGIHLYMLCDEKPAGAPQLDREQLYRMLMEQKLELAAEKYLRDLRRQTFIQVR